MKKQILASLCLLGISVSFYAGCGNEPPSPQRMVTKPPKEMTSTKKEAVTESLLPQYKDSNGICGLAENDEGSIVAVASKNECPSSDTLSNQYGYNYIFLADDFRPENVDGFCGMAHYIPSSNSLGEKDMAQLMDAVGGDINNFAVHTESEECPTPSGLSDMMLSSVGVPVIFGYNDFSINPENYPILWAESSLESVDAIEDKDISLLNEYGNTKVKDFYGMIIPKIFLNEETKALCDNNYKNCSYDKTNAVLENPRKNITYFMQSANKVQIPPYMMTRGAWSVCQGDFASCDFILDETGTRGTVRNLSTGATYSSAKASIVTDFSD